MICCLLSIHHLICGQKNDFKKNLTYLFERTPCKIRSDIFVFFHFNLDNFAINYLFMFVKYLLFVYSNISNLGRVEWKFILLQISRLSYDYSNERFAKKCPPTLAESPGLAATDCCIMICFTKLHLEKKRFWVAGMNIQIYETFFNNTS